MEGPNKDQVYKQAAEDIIKRLKELEASSSWKENGEKKCKMYKMELDGRIAAKGVAQVGFPIEKVAEFLQKDDTLPKLNNQILEFKVLYEQKDVFQINYQLYNAPWPVSKRDFVSLGVNVKESQTKVYIGIKATDHPHPQTKGVVRGQIYIGGYIVQKIGEEKSRVTYISCVDLKGNIPQMVQNQLSATQGEVAGRVESTMKKSGY